MNNQGGFIHEKETHHQAHRCACPALQRTAGARAVRLRGGVTANIGTSQGTKQNNEATADVTNVLTTNQPIPTDIKFSLERYNLIRRMYIVNGLPEKAKAMTCPVQQPIGYILCLSYGTPVAEFMVEGKVSSLNSFLSPNYVEKRVTGYEVVVNTELADVDGSYGENDEGIFFFDYQGHYWEWKGQYLYSDYPFDVDNLMIKVVG